MTVRRVQQLAAPRATHVRLFGLMGERLLVETDDPAILAAAETSFGRYAVPPDDGRPALVVRLFVGPDAAPPVVPPDAAPTAAPPATGTSSARSMTFRTHGSTFLIIGRAPDAATVDIDAGVATGWVSRSTADNAATVRYAFLEAMALSLLARGRGYVVLHAAAVVRDGVAVLLTGPAGAGKSTLAMACLRRGYGLLADDAVFVKVSPGPLMAWGSPWTHRLLPDAPTHFPELHGHPARPQPNGEHKLEIELDRAFPGRAVTNATAGPLVLLDRRPGASGVERLDPADAAAAVEILWPYDGGWSDAHEATARRLIEDGAVRLCVGGTPDEAVDELDRLLAGHPAFGPR